MVVLPIEEYDLYPKRIVRLYLLLKQKEKKKKVTILAMDVFIL